MAQGRPLELDEPPPPVRRVVLVGGIGVGLVLAALLLGLATGAPKRGFDVHPWDGPRALLCVVGIIVTGCAVSMRPGHYAGWLLGSAAGLVGYGVGGQPPAGTEWHLRPARDWIAGVPNAWDSVQVFFGAAAVFGLIATALTRAPRRLVLGTALAAIVFHFAAILSAITSPPPTPWLTDQYWKRVSRPHLQFFYFNNAYQFYSPDPGPACEVWAAIEYETDDSAAGKDVQWVMAPRRSRNYVDPMGLSFYRRLSISENVAQYHAPGWQQTEAEQAAVSARREHYRSVIPYGLRPETTRPMAQQRIEPNELVTRQVLPSYARHLAAMHADPAKKVKSIKIYRTQHSILPLNYFRGNPDRDPEIPGMSPYDPSLYLPYFQGEFTPDGKLVDSMDPMLYWLVPIEQKMARPDPNRRYDFDKYYVDFTSVHAGAERPRE